MGNGFVDEDTGRELAWEDDGDTCFGHVDPLCVPCKSPEQRCSKVTGSMGLWQRSMGWSGKFEGQQPLGDNEAGGRGLGVGGGDD